MANERVFDPEAIEEYRLFLGELIGVLENQVIPVLSTGTLSRAPAFGTAPGAAENADGQYLEFHAAAWRNLQYLRGTLHGMEASLMAVTASGDAAEEEAAVFFTDTESDLDGVAEGETVIDGAPESGMVIVDDVDGTAGGATMTTA